MSVLVQDSPPHGHREGAVIAAAVLSVLAVVFGPALAAQLGGDGPGVLVEEAPLPEAAQRVLAEMPEAYQAGGMVVVPAASDPYVAWGTAVGSERIDGEAVSLGVSGLAEYGYLPSIGATPDWLTGLGPGDNVYSEVGPLSFGCMRWPGAQECTGAVLMERAGTFHVFRSGVGSPAYPQPVASVGGFGSGGKRDVWLGWMPPGATTVWVTVVGYQAIREVPARTSERGAVAGETVWWVASSDPVSSVSFRDDRGDVVDRVTVAEDG